MEGSSERASSAIAAVVRHFAPSRIERDLLTQVFELVCARQGRPELADANTLDKRPPAAVETEYERIETHSAGRRVA